MPHKTLKVHPPRLTLSRSISGTSACFMNWHPSHKSVRESDAASLINPRLRIGWAGRRDGPPRCKAGGGAEAARVSAGREEPKPLTGYTPRGGS